MSGGSAYNLLVVELGLPGLALWIGLTTSVLVLALRRLEAIEDPELRIYLVAIVSVFIALTVQGSPARRSRSPRRVPFCGSPRG